MSNRLKRLICRIRGHRLRFGRFDRDVLAHDLECRRCGRHTPARDVLPGMHPELPRNPHERRCSWAIRSRDAGRWNEVYRHEDDGCHLIGASTSRTEAYGIAQGDRIRVLHNPLAIEVEPLDYKLT